MRVVKLSLPAKVMMARYMAHNPSWESDYICIVAGVPGYTCPITGAGMIVKRRGFMCIVTICGEAAYRCAAILSPMHAMTEKLYDLQEARTRELPGSCKSSEIISYPSPDWYGPVAPGSTLIMDDLSLAKPKA
jgi:hypothetical protein